MYDTLNFYKDEFQFYYRHFKTDISNNNRYYPYINNYYYIFYLYKGEATVQIGDTVYNLKNENIILADTNQKYCYNFPNNMEIEYFEIRIHPSFFFSIKNDKEFVRSFCNVPDNLKVINANHPEFLLIKTTAYSIRKCLEKNLGDDYVIPRINTIISELNIYYDKILPTENTTSDSIYVKIIDYIEHHYLENITYESLCNKFFISRTTLNKIMHLMTNMSLRKYVEKLRLGDAKTLLIVKGMDTEKVATMCGYKSYSAFFNAYKKYYGEAPFNHKNRSIKKWTMTK
ncbi:MAG: helix-turn-helix domain-containing protein [Acutalibacteraceae bacterium]